MYQQNEKKLIYLQLYMAIYIYRCKINVDLKKPHNCNTSELNEADRDTVACLLIESAV